MSFLYDSFHWVFCGMSGEIKDWHAKLIKISIQNISNCVSENVVEKVFDKILGMKCANGALIT